MRRIRIRPRAESDLDEIFDFLAASDLEVAIRFHGNVRRTLHEVAAMDDPGLRWESNDPRLLNVRFWKVSGFPNHLLFFTASHNEVDVIRILHAARDLQAILWRL